MRRWLILRAFPNDDGTVEWEIGGSVTASSKRAAEERARRELPLLGKFDIQARPWSSTTPEEREEAAYEDRVNADLRRGMTPVVDPGRPTGDPTLDYQLGHLPIWANTPTKAAVSAGMGCLWSWAKLGIAITGIAFVLGFFAATC